MNEYHQHTTIMSTPRAASSTPTLIHATPRRIPGSASSSETSYQLTRDRPRRASGTPSTRPAVITQDSSEASGIRSTRARVGPLPKNGPGNPLFPPLPPKLNKPRRSSQMSGLERMDGYEVKEEEREDGDEEADADDKGIKQEGQEDDEQTGKGDGDHETMTSGLSDNEADAASAHESEEGETKPVDISDDAEKPDIAEDTKEPLNETTVSFPLFETTPSPPAHHSSSLGLQESQPQTEEPDTASSSGKRSLRTRNTRDRSPTIDAKRACSTHDDEHKDDVGGDMEVDEPSSAGRDRKGAGRSTIDVRKGANQEDDEEEEIVADEELVENPKVDQPGQVDANGDVTRCICGREGTSLSSSIATFFP
ncbi:hypothetical protein QFC22_005300 [Naganishia vaughanmartiniae]|uniref:Uncharacterized protein n=1 Tax=Naganishia vaughanmartiniae TaxID=1424756 RepID=A0ACC2WVU2_9TREE|nr:hypothetical protein QFC22_005300 [Naganishia vaughanmartiniae]